MRMIRGYQPFQSTLFAAPSVSRLDPEIKINNNVMTTVGRYNARDATSALWLPDGAGLVLPVVSTGDPPVPNDESILYGPGDRSVRFPGGQVYRADTDLFADINTEDVLVEGLLRTPVDTLADLQRILSKVVTSTTRGYQVTITGSRLSFQVFGEVNYLTVNQPSNLGSNAWYFFNGFWDPSETTYATGISIHVNLVVPTSGSGNPSLVGSLTSTQNLTVCARSYDLSGKSQSGLAYFAIAKGSNIYAGGAQNLIDWEAFHKHRCHSVFGIASSKFYSFGTFTRNAIGSLEKLEYGKGIIVHRVGVNLPRFSNVGGFRGLLLEEKSVNYVAQSAAANLWSYVSGTFPTSVSSPLKNYMAYTFREDNTLNLHYTLSPYISYDIGNKYYLVTLIIAPEARAKVRVRMRTGPGSTVFVLEIDLVTGVVNSASAHIVEWTLENYAVLSGKLFKRLRIVGYETTPQGVVNRTVMIYSLNDAWEITYQGTNQDCFTLAFSQLELAHSSGNAYLWLKFDESSGAAVNDSSGNARHQVLVGDNSSFWGPGRSGNAGYFSKALANHISLPVGYFNQAQGSWGGWVKANWAGMADGDSSRVFASDGPNTNSEFRTFLNYSNDVFNWVVGNGSGIYYCALGNFSSYSDVWVHIFFTWYYDGTTQTNVRGYVDGVNIPTSNVNVPGQVSSPTAALWIGRWDGAPGGYTGAIDDFLLYQKKLDDDDIKLIYDQGALKYQGDFSTPIVTGASAVTRDSDSVLVYPYTNIKNHGSISLTFYRERRPGCSVSVWEISAGGSVNNRIYGFIDSAGYLSVQIVVNGGVEGTATVSQNICNKKAWAVGVRWKATALELVVCRLDTQVIYINSVVITQLPLGLDEDRRVIPCNAVVGENKQYDYFESDNRRLLFG